MKKIPSVFLLILIAATPGLGEETSFSRVKVPDASGKQTRAVLTFSDDNKAIEVRPNKGTQVTIPYAQIYKCSYEFTQRHRVNEGSVALAPIGVGAVVMMTKSKSHWLEIEYHGQDMMKSFVLRMDKHDYVHILDALKAHTGVEAEVLGNADKRGR